jgi:PKD repeat protein
MMKILKFFHSHRKILLTVALALITTLVYSQNPVASFTVNDSAGCAPLSIQFTNTSTNATNYLWDFGNGNTSTLPNPSITYTVLGSYTITLIAINANTNQADTLIVIDHINVLEPPDADFNASATNVCVNSGTVSFTNTSVNSISWIWDFGDGNSSSAQHPVHNYTTAGTYTVKLIATNVYNCSNIEIKNLYITVNDKPTASFTATPTNACDSNEVISFQSTSTSAVSWLWNFGDGNTSTLQNPTHVYGITGNFNVSLIVTNSKGCTDTLTTPSFVKIMMAAPVSFSASDTIGCAPVNITFTNNTPNTTAWQWDFGNGTTSNLENPVIAFNSAGTYSVTLTSTSNSGCTQTKTINNYINISQGPIANFTASNNLGCGPLTVQFTNLSSVNAVSWHWDFGYSTTSASQNPAHTYTTGGVYTVTLHAFSADGCEHIYIRNNIVNVQSPVADFNATPTTGCAPLTVDFSDSSAGNIVQWFWDFGNGNTSSQQNPSQTYSSTGNYSVMLIVTNSSGCKDTIIKNNYIGIVSGQTNYTAPPPTYVCFPYTASFTDPTTGSNSWYWDFGDGTSSTQQNPTHTYTAPGDYTVSLVTQMAGGCIQSFSPYAEYHVLGTDLQFNFTISPGICEPYTVTFNSNAPGATAYLWNFGNGDSSSQANPVYQYQSPGDYTVTLTVYSPGPGSVSGSGPLFCTTSLIKTVTVGVSNPISVSATNACLYDTLYFSCSLPGMSSYLWNFKDGNFSTMQNPSHIYTSSRDYLVSLTVTDSTGCSKTFNINPVLKAYAPVADFVITSPTAGCDSLTVSFTNVSQHATSYLWDFGNGASSVQTNPVYTYTTPGIYTVTLFAFRTGCHNIKTINQAFIVSSPAVNFTVTQSGSCIPLTASFASQAPAAISWFWDFGDGNTSTLENPVHNYTSAPVSGVSLTITDSSGCEGKIIKPLNYFNANFSASVTAGCVPFTTLFTPLINNANSYYWDFGDGNTSTLSNPAHTFSSGGIYDVTLIISTANCNDTIIYPMYITASDPVAEFYSPTVAACAPTLVNFIDQATDANSWYWDFGDGTSSTNQNPSHIYNVAGYYTITQIVTNALGCTDTMIKIDYIAIPGSVSSFIAGPLAGCGSLTASLTDSSYNAGSWSWSFGDGNTSAQQNPVHTYTDVGSFTPILVTQDSLGCTSYYSFPQPLVVHPVPVAAGTSDGGTGCNPFTVSFIDQSTGNTNLIWNFGNGDTSTLSNPSFTYLNPGIYNPYVVAINQFGCRDSATMTIPVTVNATPVPDFTIWQSYGCPPFNPAILNTSSQLVGANYYWDFGNGINSTSAVPSVTLTDPGFYDVTLIIVNSNGCSDTIIKPAFIKVADEIPPPVSQILAVSVVDNNRVSIKFSLNPAPDLLHYILYRKNNITGNFDTIKVLPPTLLTAFSFDTTTYDNGLNTLDNVYTYKLQTVDSCGHTISLDSLTAHSTINVTAEAQNKNILVRWTPYEGCPVNTYEIYRTEIQNGSTQFIASVSPEILNYLDTTASCPVEFSYRIKGTDLCGNPISSLSDTSNATPVNILKNQVVEVVRGTVVNNQLVLCEWLPPVLEPGKVAYYKIYRSDNSSNFRLINTVPAGVHEYLDHNVNVNSDYYYYMIEIINFCEIITTQGNFASSVLLKAEKDDYDHNKLRWTPYVGWDFDGVDHYTIERQDINGNWIILQTVDGDILDYHDKF